MVRNKWNLVVVKVAMLSMMSLTLQQGVAHAAGGPVVLTGIDAEDGGPGAHGPIGNYIRLVNSVLTKASNGGKGILVVGANGSNPIDFWNAIGKGTGQSVRFAAETADFKGFQMVAVVGSYPETSGGLTSAQNDVLGTRQLDFANFVNGGGGLLGNTQSNFTNQYAYVGGLGTFSSATVSDFSDIDPTPAGAQVGITNELDVCCWHNIFTGYPTFVQPLAYRAGIKDAVALGGGQVTLPSQISLTPRSATGAVGTNHTVTARVVDGQGRPLDSALVDFSIAGPNKSATGQCSPTNCHTSGTGEVQFSYIGTLSGDDTIGACFTPSGQSAICASAIKSWTGTVPQARSGKFSCRATAMRLGTREQAVANAPDEPCLADNKLVAEATFSSREIAKLAVSGHTLNASTDQMPNLASAPAPGDNGTAGASVAEAIITSGTEKLGLTGLASQAKVECAAPAGGLIPKLTSSSRVATLRVNGVAINVNGSMNLRLGALDVAINERLLTSGAVTQRALKISAAGRTLLTLAEAKADFSGNPCGSRPKGTPPGTNPEKAPAGKLGELLSGKAADIGQTTLSAGTKVVAEIQTAANNNSVSPAVGAPPANPSGDASPAAQGTSGPHTSGPTASDVGNGNLNNGAISPSVQGPRDTQESGQVRPADDPVSSRTSAPQPTSVAVSPPSQIDHSVLKVAEHGGRLPVTGAYLVLPLLAVGVSLVGSGALIIFSQRRKRGLRRPPKAAIELFQNEGIVE